MALAAGLEILLQTRESVLPVAAGQDQEKVVAADMAEEIAPGVDLPVQALGQFEQDLVTLGVAVAIVQRISLFYLHRHANPVCQKPLHYSAKKIV